MDFKNKSYIDEIFSIAFLMAIAESGTAYAGNDKAYSYSLENVQISRINSEIQDGNTMYSIIISGQKELFIASYSVSEELANTRDGDFITIKYIDDGNGIMSIVEFDNLAYGIQKSEAEQAREEMDAEVGPIKDPSQNEIVDVNPGVNEDWWNSLTDEEKAEIMKGDGM